MKITLFRHTKFVTKCEKLTEICASTLVSFFSDRTLEGTYVYVHNLLTFGVHFTITPHKLSFLMELAFPRGGCKINNAGHLSIVRTNYTSSNHFMYKMTADWYSMRISGIF